MLVLIAMFWQARQCFGQADSLSIIPDQTILSEGLINYLNIIPAGKEKNYGLNSKSEFSRIETGEPMYILMTPEDISENKNGKVKLESINEWYIPLFIDDECRLFLVLSKKNYKQEIVGIGYAKLAESMNCLNAFNSKDYKKDGFLFIPELESKFLIKKEKNNLLFYPLGQTLNFFPLYEKEYLTYEELNSQLISKNYITLH